MRRIRTILLTALLLISMVSCAHAQPFRNDLESVALSERVLNTIDADTDYAVGADEFLNDYFSMPDYVRDHSIRFASVGNNLNEVGIFHTADGKTAEMKDVLQQYLSDSLEKNQAWYQSYIPEEIPKLRDAEVRIFGNYAVYAILDQTDRSAFFDAVERELQAEA